MGYLEYVAYPFDRKYLCPGGLTVMKSSLEDSGVVCSEGSARSEAPTETMSAVSAEEDAEVASVVAKKEPTLGEAAAEETTTDVVLQAGTAASHRSSELDSTPPQLGTASTDSAAESTPTKENRIERGAAGQQGAASAPPEGATCLWFACQPAAL